MEPLQTLGQIVGDTGEVNSVYGGFEIKILNPALFPWYRLFKELIDIGQRVWVEKKEDEFYIVSEPRIQ